MSDVNASYGRIQFNNLVSGGRVVAMTLVSASVRLEEKDLALLKSIAGERGVKFSEFFREFVTDALSRDDAQGTANELARLSDETKDLRAEVLKLRSNLSVVLELILRNAPGPDDEVDAVLQQLRERNLIR